jgi:hypothetical protein
MGGPKARQTYRMDTSYVLDVYGNVHTTFTPETLKEFTKEGIPLAVWNRVIGGWVANASFKTLLDEGQATYLVSREDMRARVVWDDHRLARNRGLASEGGGSSHTQGRTSSTPQ